MAICQRCGKRGFFIQLRSVPDCDMRMCKDCCKEVGELNARIAEEKLQEEKRIANNYAVKYSRICELYREAKSVDMSDGIEKVKEHMGLCKNFVDGCDELLNDYDYFGRYKEKIRTESPFGYRISYSGKEPKEYIKNAQFDVQRLLWDCRNFISNSDEFTKAIEALPKVSIALSDTSIIPDEDADFSSVVFTNVTRKSNLGKLSDFIVVDVETTGLNPYKCEITQLSAIRFSEFQPVDCFTTYIKPKKKIPQSTININGITDETVMNAPPIEQVISSFRDYIGDKKPIVGHNLIFDLKFLCVAGCITLNTKRKFYDTLDLSKRAYSSDCYKLDYLDKAALLIDRRDAHDSVSDCLITGMLFHDICKTRTS